MPVGGRLRRLGEEWHEERESTRGLEPGVPGQHGQVDAAVQVVHQPRAAELLGFQSQIGGCVDGADGVPRPGAVPLAGPEANEVSLGCSAAIRRSVSASSARTTTCRDRVPWTDCNTYCNREPREMLQ